MGGEGWLVGERLPARSPAAGVVEGGGGPYGPGLPGLGAALATGGLRRVRRRARKPGGQARSRAGAWQQSKAAAEAAGAGGGGRRQGCSASAIG